MQSYARKSGNKENEIYYETTFDDIPEDFGEIGAVKLENEHRQEMFVKNIVLQGFPSGTTAVDINCESWIHSKFDNPEKRVFFTNKVTYLISNYLHASLSPVVRLCIELQNLYYGILFDL